MLTGGELPKKDSVATSKQCSTSISISYQTGLGLSTEHLRRSRPDAPRTYEITLVGIRAATYHPDEIVENGDQFSIESMPCRVRFAMRFGKDIVDDFQRLHRSSVVRSAFNSPFWPFILASTSLGQEGLDFHLYCHAVVLELAGEPGRSRAAEKGESIDSRDTRYEKTLRSGMRRLLFEILVATLGRQCFEKRPAPVEKAV